MAPGPARSSVGRGFRPDRPSTVGADCVGAHVGHATWQRARRRCETLLDSQSELVLLHGDLHLGNVLDGGLSRGLIAIDPKACVGDPCFDAVGYVVAGAGQDGVEARCQRVATACGFDGDRLYAWSRAIAPMATDLAPHLWRSRARDRRAAFPVLLSPRDISSCRSEPDLHAVDVGVRG
ncbi:aminoglycoside phosphotransferase family protein [Streptomyces sp. NPDC020607]|uniref:aminoglycoside phosphotransferase family protein n=1 Tax=Streptomyces sp. NPDC020607 TaxID=3365082 RepID=UPI003796581F